MDSLPCTYYALMPELVNAARAWNLISRDISSCIIERKRRINGTMRLVLHPRATLSQPTRHFILLLSRGFQLCKRPAAVSLRQSRVFIRLARRVLSSPHYSSDYLLHFQSVIYFRVALRRQWQYVQCFEICRDQQFAEGSTFQIFITGRSIENCWNIFKYATQNVRKSCSFKTHEILQK